MIRGAAGRYPGDLQLGLTRDTRRNRRVPGENMLAGHVALSEASGEITLAGLAAHSGLPGGSYWFGVLGTGVALARHPKDFFGGALGVGFYGTRGSLKLLPDVLTRLKHSGTGGKLRRLSEGFSRRGIRGHLAAREESGREGFPLGTREHVACSEDVSKEASGETLGKASGT